jgi:DNA-binding GntR family transcriptional regulator
MKGRAANPADKPARGKRELSETLAAQILGHIRETGLPSGAHLTAQELAGRFSVSRFPVAHALELLAAKGVLTHKPNRGYFVADVVPESADALGLAKTDELSSAYFRIAEDHLGGALPDPASEAYLRERYGLSQGQLGRVLSRIVQEGWAERRPGSGWSFSPMLATPESLAQTYRVRLALEPAALLEPTYRLEPEALARCRAAELRLLAGAIETDSADALHDRGVRFHETIVGASGNPFFLDTVRRINSMRRLLSYRSMIDRRRYRQQCEEHVEILDLLEAGRNARAAAALKRHLQHTMSNLRLIRGILEKPGR